MNGAVSVKLRVAESARGVLGSAGRRAESCGDESLGPVVPLWVVSGSSLEIDGGAHMQKQAARQQARLRARQARATVREEEAQRERRLATWGEQVAVALAERDQALADCEQRAGRALRAMIEDEGLSTQAALAWCGDDTLTGRQVYRLIRELIDDEDGGDGDDLHQREDSTRDGPE